MHKQPPPRPSKNTRPSLKPTKAQIEDLLDKFRVGSKTAAKLLGNDYKKRLTIVSVGTGTGGAAQGGNVTIDVKKKESFMSVEEAAESAIFEFQNTNNASENSNTKNKLGTTSTLKQYGITMAQTEFKSTKAVKAVLTEYINSTKTNKNIPTYVPSKWGGEHYRSSATAQTFSNLKHDNNKNLPSKFALKSWELYAYEAIEDARLLSKVVKNMATLTYLGNSYSGVQKKKGIHEFLPDNRNTANNIDNYLCCVELGKYLSNKKGIGTVTWKGNVMEWDFTPDMITVTGKARPGILKLKQKFQRKCAEFGVSISFL